MHEEELECVVCRIKMFAPWATWEDGEREDPLHLCSECAPLITRTIQDLHGRFMGLKARGRLKY